MNQKSNQSKEQLDSELLKRPPTKVLPEETLIALLQSGDSRGLEEAQKYIDDHIKKQCDAKGVDFWDYYLDPRYPEAPDNYNGYDQSVAIMAYNVVHCPQTALDKVYEIRPGEFQTRGVTQYHLVAKFSLKGTRWAVRSFYINDYDEKFNRTEIVKQFDSLKQASDWVRGIEFFE
jgi:hypothetical protein